MQELNHADYTYSTKIGTVLGFFAGWAIGITLLLYLQSDALNSWPWVGSIPIWNGLGWGLFGFIVGGGGIFARLGRRTVAGTSTPDLKRAA